MKYQENWIEIMELFDFGFIQAQAVGDDGYAAESHGQGGQDGMQLTQ